MIKILVVLCFAGLVLAQHHEYEKKVEFEDHYAYPQYKFEYNVHDPHTHDFKTQHETRDGDKVSGFYTLKEADGTTRIVKYTADKHTGFNAHVERQGHAIHPEYAHYEQKSFYHH